MLIAYHYYWIRLFAAGGPVITLTLIKYDIAECPLLAAQNN